MTTQPSKKIETFDNPHDFDYLVQSHTEEFTCLCPKTGQPDFAEVTLEYVPNKKCVELKSLKLFLWSFREVGAFHEKITGDIANAIVEAIEPQWLRLRMFFKVRGGIETTVTVQVGSRPEHV